mgnify:CR=1 FL=1
MAEPNIVAFRIDERLIHGQGQLWIKALGVNTVIVADDGASEDPMQQMLYEGRSAKDHRHALLLCSAYL